MTKALKKSAIALAALTAGLTATSFGAAMAQQFGGLPTVTPQAQAERARREENREAHLYRRHEKRPAYVVVAQGGPSGGQDRER